MRGRHFIYCHIKNVFKTAVQARAHDGHAPARAEAVEVPGLAAPRARVHVRLVQDDVARRARGDVHELVEHRRGLRTRRR